MSEVSKPFAETHYLRELVKDVVIATDVPTNMAEVDLRFLRVVRYADTYYGYGDPTDGLDCTLVFYGSKVVYEKWAEYWNGSCEQRGSKGNEMYFHLYYAAQLYLKLLAIGYKKFFRDKVGKGKDIIFVSKKDWELLSMHPLFIETVADFGLQLKETKKGGFFKVVVTKFFEPTNCG